MSRSSSGRNPRDRDAGGVRVLDTRSAATAALTASRLIISNERTSGVAPGTSLSLAPHLPEPEPARLALPVWREVIDAFPVKAGAR
jgi:hypothetical protein